MPKIKKQESEDKGKQFAVDSSGLTNYQIINIGALPKMLNICLTITQYCE
jgi:hypothetical protein